MSYLEVKTLKAHADRGCCGEDAEANSRWEQSTQAHLSEDFRFELAVLTLIPKSLVTKPLNPFQHRDIPCDSWNFAPLGL